MRDPELMLKLLREMGDDPHGELISPLYAYGVSKESQKQIHHVELLVDAGHAEWRSPKKQIVRITNDGYDFLNAVESGGQFRKFKELFDKGMPYADAAQKIVELATKLSAM